MGITQTTLIHLVGVESETRLWLAHALMNAMTGGGASGILIDVVDAQTHDNEALRGDTHMGRVAIVVADHFNARHCDLAEHDFVIRLDLSPYAAQAAAEVQRLAADLGHAECAYLIARART